MMWGSMRLGGRDRKVDLLPVPGRDQRFACHRFDCWPVLPEEVRRIVVIVRLHLNAAGFPAGAVRYLEVKIEADGLRIFSDRLMITAHLVSPRFASRILDS
jgi:hypothetical protein